MTNLYANFSDLAAAFWRVMPADPDPTETREWLDAFNSLIEYGGRERATYLLRKLLDEARARRMQNQEPQLAGRPRAAAWRIFIRIFLSFELSAEEAIKLYDYY